MLRRAAMKVSRGTTIPRNQTPSRRARLRVLADLVPGTYVGPHVELRERLPPRDRWQDRWTHPRHPERGEAHVRNPVPLLHRKLVGHQALDRPDLVRPVQEGQARPVLQFTG